MPAHSRPKDSAATSVVAHPQNGSSTVSPSLLDPAIYGAHDSPPSRRIATASWYAAVYASRASGLWSGALALMAGR